MDRKTKIIKLREQGLTFQEIGKQFHITRQRAHQIFHHIPKYHIFLKKYKHGVVIKQEGRDYLKEIVRIRDGYACQFCGKKWHIGERRLDVHHLDEEIDSKKGLEYQNCKCLDRMITLCHKCHFRLHALRKKLKNNEGVDNFT